MNKFFYFFIVSLFFVSCQNQNQKETTPEKPNIVYILADDLGYGDLSCYGQTHFETPNIDNLAENGMKFTQHYSGSTVCAPSRSSLMTGQHTGHT
ncbi:MAG: sulfatase-like hydrolase/transferase, partial [Prolixibacteraceae bacterium]